MAPRWNLSLIHHKQFLKKNQGKHYWKLNSCIEKYFSVFNEKLLQFMSSLLREFTLPLWRHLMGNSFAINFLNNNKTPDLEQKKLDEIDVTSGISIFAPKS